MNATSSAINAITFDTSVAGFPIEESQPDSSSSLDQCCVKRFIKHTLEIQQSF